MIAKEIERLKKEQMEERRKNRLAENYEQRVKDMDYYLKHIQTGIRSMMRN